MSTTDGELLAQAGIESAPGMLDLLSELRGLAPDRAPEPSPELATLLAGGHRSAPRGTRPRVARLAALGVALGASGLTMGVGAAAAGVLPPTVQHAVAQWSRHHLPFDLPEPLLSVGSQPRPAPSPRDGARSGAPSPGVSPSRSVTLASDALGAPGESPSPPQDSSQGSTASAAGSRTAAQQPAGAQPTHSSNGEAGATRQKQAAPAAKTKTKTRAAADSVDPRSARGDHGGTKKPHPGTPKRPHPGTPKKPHPTPGASASQPAEANDGVGPPGQQKPHPGRDAGVAQSPGD